MVVRIDMEVVNLRHGKPEVPRLAALGAYFIELVLITGLSESNRMIWSRDLRILPKANLLQEAKNGSSIWLSSISRPDVSFWGLTPAPIEYTGDVTDSKQMPRRP